MTTKKDFIELGEWQLNAFKQRDKYKQALEEIRDRTIHPDSLPEDYTLKKYILEKCNEVLNDRD